MPSINHLATFSPSSSSRTWLTAPHPTLPIAATACSDKTVRLNSLQNFQHQTTISGGHKRSIRSVSWKPNSPSESVLATGSFDASAGIWKRDESGRTANTEVDFTSGLAGGDAEKPADDDEEEWRFAVLLDGHDSEIKSVSFCPTAPLLATCSRDKSVWIWEDLGDDDNFETVAVLQDHEGDVKCVTWHPEEPLLASGSYDDTVRLWREDEDDWACCCLLKGHGGTVWWVEFEPKESVGRLAGGEGGEEWIGKRKREGPRLMSSSDDCSVRVWKRVPKEGSAGGHRTGLPSIWKNRNSEEEWVEDARLPTAHERAVYAVSWSKRTGRVASTGSDGKIVVYEERWKGKDANGDVTMVNGGDAAADGSGGKESQSTKGSPTEWVVLAEIDNAHDVIEVNHIVWASRADKGKRYNDEEVLISTGDDGEVKIWSFDP